MRTGLCQERGPLCQGFWKQGSWAWQDLHFYRLISSILVGGRYWFSFLSLLSHSHPTPAFTHVPRCSAPHPTPSRQLRLLDILPHLSWGHPASSSLRLSPGRRAASEARSRGSLNFPEGLHPCRPLRAFWTTTAGLMRRLGSEMKRVSQEEGRLKMTRNNSGHNPSTVHLRVSWSQRGILMNNGPSWQTVQGCGASLKKQQITQAPGPPGRGLVRSWRAGARDFLQTPRKRWVNTEGAPPGALAPEMWWQSSAL